MHAFHRTLSSAAVAATLAFAAVPAAHAQAKPATPAAAPASAPAVVIDAEKQKLIDRILALLKPENMVVGMVQRPAMKAMQDSNIALHQANMTQEKIDKTMKDIETDVKKYVDTATPVAMAAAKKDSAPALSPLLAQNFSNDELKQLLAILESPLRAKLEQLGPQLERALGEKVVADVGPEINKNLQAMTQSVGTKLRAAVSVN
jgi:hypothetical protein